MQNYKPRIADKLLTERLNTLGGVIIQGPKWCGKTTTARQQAASQIMLTDPDSYTLAQLSLKQALSGANPRLVDEWQEVPSLWDVARHIIDDRNQPGLFIFTGSAVPADRNKIRHSGTGRFSWLTMRTMSLFESGDSLGSIRLKDLFDNESDLSLSINERDIGRLAFLICRGGWPAISANATEANSLAIAEEYVQGVTYSDIIRADGTKRTPARTLRLLRSLARHQGSQASLATICADMNANDALEMSDTTAAGYLSALANIFVTEDAPAWNPNLRSRTAIRTADTRYFSDPSIAAAALGVGPEDLLKDLNTMGLLFETMAVRDLRVYAQAIKGDVYHYRDKSGLECDAVVHLRDGRYGLVEIKLGGETLIEQGASTLKNLASKIDAEKTGSPSFMMVLVGVGAFARRRDDGVWEVPITCLRD